MRISVRNLVEFILRSGDIDNRRGGPLDKDAMQEGSRIHRKIQGRMGSNYKAEVPLSVDIAGDGYVLTVEGRADGIFHEQFADIQSSDPERWMRTVLETDLGEDAYIDIPAPQELYTVDEIKGVYRDVNTLEEPYAVHLAQTKC